MDKSLKHGKMDQMLRNEHEKPHSPMRAGQVNQRDSLEYDTESLAQERACQQQLQRCIGCPDQTDYKQSQEDNTDSLEEGDGDDEDVNDDETADLQIHDSLEVAAHPSVKRNPNLLPSEYLNTQVNEKEESR